MSDEGTTEDALDRLREIDPERHAEIVSEKCTCRQECEAEVHDYDPSIKELEAPLSDPCCHSIATLSGIDADKVQELGSCGCKQARHEAWKLAQRIKELEHVLKTSSDLQDKLLVKALEREREMSNELYEALQNCIAWWGPDYDYAQKVMQKFEAHKKDYIDER